MCFVSFICSVLSQLAYVCWIIHLEVIFKYFDTVDGKNKYVYV